MRRRRALLLGDGHQILGAQISPQGVDQLFVCRVRIGTRPRREWIHGCSHGERRHRPLITTITSRTRHHRRRKHVGVARMNAAASEHRIHAHHSGSHRRHHTVDTTRVLVSHRRHAHPARVLVLHTAHGLHGAMTIIRARGRASERHLRQLRQSCELGLLGSALRHVAN